ncbi:MAG: HypC/HybG/HupF family hydrogenase formation chaperone [Dehalococcoidia bacterium]|nr:HypC/HybG/HupF family hydrogenase formation chaperone [Planctomycetota bacterium]MCK6564930.1 HypC/HybG/HupF family hydrogenase formation chaperone [Dehalococcoidia bacterium]
MCLGIPGEVKSVTPGALRMGKVAFGGIVKEICLEYVPEAEVGDYVVVHAGFAISRVDREGALRVFKYLDELGEMNELKEGDR